MGGYATDLYDRPSNGVSDIFTDIMGGGQDIIDGIAKEAGIEKGGTIDTLVSGAASVGRNATGLPSIDAAIKKVTGGGGTSTAPTTTNATSGGTGFFKSISVPWALGGAAVGGLGIHFAFKRVWATVLGAIGGGVLLGVTGPKIMASFNK